MTKFRNKKRYFRKFWEEVHLHCNSEYGWCDYFHIHPDFYGFGGRSKSFRFSFVRLAAQAFNTLKLASKHRDANLQVWMVFCKDGSYDDAIFIHTPNPQSEFPCKMNNTFEPHKSELLRVIKDETPGLNYFCSSDFPGVIYVYDPDFGVPIR